MNKRKPDAPQLSMPLEAQAMLTWDARGNVLVVAVKNQFVPLPATVNDATITKQKKG